MAAHKTSLDPTKANAAVQPALGQTAILLFALTLIAAAGGGLLGMILEQGPSASSAGSHRIDEAASNDQHRSKSEDHRAEGRTASSGEIGQTAPQKALQVKELPPIVTNLANPQTAWVRLQSSIVYDTKEVTQPDLLITELMSDFVAFLRTISLASIEGADGLRRLHEDLSERAAIRSEGRVREFIIQALVVQ